MAEPKKKLSKTRTNKRRSVYAVPSIGMARCSNCKEVILPHVLCPYCGFYRGKATRLTKTKRLVAEDKPAN